MRAVIRRHLTYANVMATIAVFLALGGTTIAAGYVVTRSGQIKDGAVTGSDVKNSSLSTGDIRDDSLHGDDIQDGSLTARDFAGAVRGEQGLQGVEGPRGPKGDQGARGLPGGIATSLPSGDTLRGVYAVGATADSDQDAVTFQVPLTSKPQAVLVPLNGTPPEACAGGTVAEPQAEPGFLCVFERDRYNRGYTLITDESGQVSQGGTFGFVFFASTDQPTMGGMHSSGSWAVTAP